MACAVLAGYGISGLEGVQLLSLLPQQEQASAMERAAPQEGMPGRAGAMPAAHRQAGAAAANDDADTDTPDMPGMQSGPVALAPATVLAEVRRPLTAADSKPVLKPTAVAALAIPANGASSRSSDEAAPASLAVPTISTLIPQVDIGQRPEPSPAARGGAANYRQQARLVPPSAECSTALIAMQLCGIRSGERP
jgi:hypothetical protein